MPNQLTQRLEPYRTYSRVRYNALYSAGSVDARQADTERCVRYDHSWSYYPEQQIGPTRFLPTEIVFPESKGVIGYNDITPRAGVAYDLFGNGKTALKVNAGKYLEAAVNGNGNYSALLPTSRMDTTQTRNWTDSNNNRVADCDLLNAREAARRRR